MQEQGKAAAASSSFASVSFISSAFLASKQNISFNLNVEFCGTANAICWGGLGENPKQIYVWILHPELSVLTSVLAAKEANKTNKKSLMPKSLIVRFEIGRAIVKVAVESCTFSSTAFLF